jgi:hypothetical protein
VKKSRDLADDFDSVRVGRRHSSVKMPSRKPRLDQERSQWRDIRHQWREIARQAARDLTIAGRLSLGDWS